MAGLSSSDGRFAPSPTGPLHLGSLRTALIAWLFACSAGARFRMRVEDLDPQRSRPSFEPGQLADLRSLGIDWDGPIVRQSQRQARYADALATLERLGRLYPCFCTGAEIQEATLAPHGFGGGYPGTCLALSDAERARRIAAGDQHALRLRADRELVAFDDRLLGQRSTIVDDFVVRRADGVAAYQLSCVVDDAAQAIGEVVRGADLADSTPRQILLARLLGLPVPRYAHVPLVLGPDGARLAKRHGAVTLADRDEPVGATLARLAHSLGLARGRERVRRARDLLDEFDPARLPRTPITLP
jgi:glutamyl-tRNA synthetase